MAIDTVSGRRGRWWVRAGGIVLGVLAVGACPVPGVRADVIVAGPGQTLVVGTEGPDILIGGARSHVLDGRGGDDLLLGGPAGDTLLGGPGNDLLLGRGAPPPSGGGYGDILSGGPGDDLLLSGGDADLLLGHEGDDTLVATGRSPVLDGGPGADRCVWRPERRQGDPAGTVRECEGAPTGAAAARSARDVAELRAALARIRAASTVLSGQSEAEDAVQAEALRRAEEVLRQELARSP